MTVQEARESEVAYVGVPDIPVGMTVREYCRSRTARASRTGARRPARIVGRWAGRGPGQAARG